MREESIAHRQTPNETTSDDKTTRRLYRFEEMGAHKEFIILEMR